MAMTKKERAEFDALILRAETLAALRWTQPVERDVMPPSEWGQSVSEGWDYNLHRLLSDNALTSYAVYEAWSRMLSNGEGNYRDGASAAQGKLALFSSKKLALLALRHELEKYAAEKLRLIDKAIAECDDEAKGAKQ